MADLGPVVQDEFTGRHIPLVAVTLGTSPAAYQAPARGYLSLVGGTVTAVTLTRNGTATTIATTAQNYPMSSGDILTVTYSAAPTSAQFVPN